MSPYPTRSGALRRTAVAFILTALWAPSASHAMTDPPSPIAVPSAVPERVLEDYSSAWHAVSDTVEERAPGRNIRKWGVETRRGARPATATELRTSTARLRAMLPSSPDSSVETVVADTASPTVPSGGGPGEATAQCESGGDPTAVSPDGVHRGKWQFKQSTFDAYAPPGYAGQDPASVPESVQDAAAAKAPRSSWPNC